MDENNFIRKHFFNILVGIITLTLFICGINTLKLDRTNYTPAIDYGLLSYEQKTVFDAILQCKSNNVAIVPNSLSMEELDQVVDHIGLYFGTNLAHINTALWRKGYAELNLDLLADLELYKETLDIEVTEVIAKLYDGTTSFKLLQISNYLAATITYSADIKDIEPLSGLSGKGSCMTYSMLFYKIAMQLGIQTYICYGEVDNGKSTALHAWNMVIIDGETYFYDITWYDSFVPNIKYLHSKTAWGRNFYCLNYAL